MSDEDREFMMLRGSVGIRVSEVVTGLFEDSLSFNDQIAFGNQLMELAEGFRQRPRTKGIGRGSRYLDTASHFPSGTR